MLRRRLLILLARGRAAIRGGGLSVVVKKVLASRRLRKTTLGTPCGGALAKLSDVIVLLCRATRES